MNSIQKIFFEKKFMYKNWNLFFFVLMVLFSIPFNKLLWVWQEKLKNNLWNFGSIKCLLEILVRDYEMKAFRHSNEKK